MNRELFHIFGPLSINSFGLMIACGLLIFIWRVTRNPRFTPLMTIDQFLDVLMVGICVSVVGARAICMATEWHLLDSWVDVMKFWQGGYSIVGAMLACVAFLPFYLTYRKLPVLNCLDLFALYAPLMQAIARFGCFFAGCCYGKTTTLPWAITYCEPTTIAPLHTAVHPTQIYSSLMLFIIFLVLRYWAQKKFKLPGQIICLYLLLAGFERFMVDFFRDDQEFFATPMLSIFSLYQWIALSIGIFGLVAFMYITLRAQPHEQTLNEPI